MKPTLTGAAYAKDDDHDPDPQAEATFYARQDPDPDDVPACAYGAHEIGHHLGLPHSQFFIAPLLCQWPGLAQSTSATVERPLDLRCIRHPSRLRFLY
jgi:hypothetical protein